MKKLLSKILNSSSELFQNLKPHLIEFLKGRAVKFALKKILGAASMGGFRAWLVKFIVTELFEEVAEPIVKAALNGLGYGFERASGEIKVWRLDDARTNNNQTDYDNTSDDIMG